MKIQLSGEAFQQICQVFSEIQRETMPKPIAGAGAPIWISTLVPGVRFFLSAQYGPDRLTFFHPGVSEIRYLPSGIVQAVLRGLFAKLDHELKKTLPDVDLTEPSGEGGMVDGLDQTLDVYLGYCAQDRTIATHFIVRLTTKTNYRNGGSVTLNYPTFKCEVEVIL